MLLMMMFDAASMMSPLFDAMPLSFAAGFFAAIAFQMISRCYYATAATTITLIFFIFF